MYFRQERGTWTGILFSIAKNHWPIISDVDWTAIGCPIDITPPKKFSYPSFSHVFINADETKK
jgi:hypothetical protein